MYAKLTQHDNEGYKARVFNPETYQYQELMLEQCPSRDAAETALKRQIPDVRIAKNHEEFVQWIAALPARITRDRMDKFTWGVGDLVPVEQAPRKKHAEESEGK